MEKQALFINAKSGNVEVKIVHVSHVLTFTRYIKKLQKLHSTGKNIILPVYCYYDDFYHKPNVRKIEKITSIEQYLDFLNEIKYTHGMRIAKMPHRIYYY